MIYSKDDILQIEMSDELKQFANLFVGRAINKNEKYFDCVDDAAVIVKLEKLARAFRNR